MIELTLISGGEKVYRFLLKSKEDYKFDDGNTIYFKVDGKEKVWNGDYLLEFK